MEVAHIKITVMIIGKNLIMDVAIKILTSVFSAF